MSKSSSNMFFLGFFLCAVCVVATAVMGGAALLTKGPIERASARKIAGSLRRILPDFDNDPLKNVCTVSGVRFYTAKKQSVVVGYAGEVSVNSGYGGKMEALISFYPDGKIRHFVVTGHSETPGLGSLAVERVNPVTVRSLFCGKKVQKSGSLPPNRILDQYSGQSLKGSSRWRQPWLLTKEGGDVEYLTGATISSRAVNELAWKCSNAFLKFLAQQQNQPSSPGVSSGRK